MDVYFEKKFTLFYDFFFFLNGKAKSYVHNNRCFNILKKSIRVFNYNDKRK